MNIEIREPRPWSETFVQTALRIGVGLTIILHGVVGLIELRAVSQLSGSHLSVMNALSIAELYATQLLWIGGELLAGCGLILGFMTRLSAFAVAGFAILRISLAYIDHGLSAYQFAVYESSFLLLATALFLFVMGGGSFSVDFGLRERARIKAIQKDDIWLQPPYVTASNTPRN
jgi:uncharacterized membrane protein YphA (DoxX/SURF4 family)